MCVCVSMCAGGSETQRGRTREESSLVLNVNKIRKQTDDLEDGQGADISGVLVLGPRRLSVVPEDRV